MKITIITLFPEMFAGVFDHSMLFKAQDKKIVEFEIINLREFGLGDRKTVDDSPYGGGDGMLLKPEPLFAAVVSAKGSSSGSDSRVLLMTPRGSVFNQKQAQDYADASQNLIIICGRYEGYDERIISLVDDQVSIGKYVLTGGEIPAMIIADSVVRLIPGVLGGDHSAEIESYSGDDPEFIEFPQYTRPEVFKEMSVPDVLLSGNHAEIDKWRAEQSKNRANELKD